MSWPPDEPEAIEAELMCEAWCLEEGLEIIWFAYGDFIPDEDDYYFEPATEEDNTCPWCGTRGEWMLL